MRATGIIRRIDDLGRIVIPKEIRKVLRIREGDPVEIYTNEEGEIVLKKYSHVGEIKTFAQEYAESIASILGCGVLVCDRDEIIAVAGMPKKELLGKNIHKDLEEAIDDRESMMAKKGEGKFIKIVGHDNNEYSGQVVQTIISEGDAIGAIVLVARDENKTVGEMEYKAAVIAANFIGKQMEG